MVKFMENLFKWVFIALGIMVKMKIFWRGCPVTVVINVSCHGRQNTRCGRINITVW